MWRSPSATLFRSPSLVDYCNEEGFDESNLVEDEINEHEESKGCIPFDNQSSATKGGSEEVKQQKATQLVSNFAANTKAAAVSKDGK